MCKRYTPEEQLAILAAEGDVVFDRSYRERFGIRRERVFLFHGVENFVVERNGKLIRVNGKLCTDKVSAQKKEFLDTPHS